MHLYMVELEPEVASWLRSLTAREFGQVDVYVGMLAERATTLGEPWSRNLGEGVRELRFHLHPREMRITYWLAPDRRIVLLTVFRKTRMRETEEVARAKALRKLCESEHDRAHTDFDREVPDHG
ncbi:type II toxin-antitoxin system RelE/ParE family toxin [Nocardia sp. NPDC060259]|uniref:type II toxin-antitoxin system RelE/ParE family toxin n=1 Tax=Nocardia sp. NPDC060259 TaxID=3347088 RepID=UPI003666BE5B